MILTMATAMLLTTACGSYASQSELSGTPQIRSEPDTGILFDNDSSEHDEPAQAQGILIAYFSRTGNTGTVAEHVKTLSGGELFEIKTVKPYPDDYNACLVQASDELAADYRPELSTHVSDMDDYHVIFIGYPIWHGTTPMAIRSFLEEYDFSGKTVIPFCTSGGSGIGQSVSSIRNLCPASDIPDGLCINRSNLDNAYEMAREWVGGLDIDLGKPSVETRSDESGGRESDMTNINITVGSATFSAKLYNNDAARALLAQFPMTVNMSELNGNEKYYRLSEKLPTAAEQVSSTQAGDLMLYGSDCLVLFYERFSTSYSYTRLGHIEDPSGLAGALGRGSVEISFSIGN